LRKKSINANANANAICSHIIVFTTINPHQFPLDVQAGGHISFIQGVGRFDQLCSKAAGALSFTRFAVLDDDLAPPLYFFSSLGKKCRRITHINFNTASQILFIG